MEISQNTPSRDQINSDVDEMIEAVNEVIAPIWKPESYFRILMDVQDSVSLQDGAQTAHSKRCSLGFRTSKPIGFFSDIAPIVAPTDVSEPALDSVPQSPTTRLSFYIDDARSYPDPSGNTLYAKPLYYKAAQIELAFNRKYVAHFFGEWPAYANAPAKNYALDIKIIDPAVVTEPPQENWQAALVDPTQTNVASLAANIPDDPSQLRQFAGFLMNEVQSQALMIEKLKHQLFGLRKGKFGSSGEGLDQLGLRLEDEETGQEQQAASLKPIDDDEAPAKTKPVRRALPEHLLEQM